MSEFWKGFLTAWLVLGSVSALLVLLEAGYEIENRFVIILRYIVTGPALVPVLLVTAIVSVTWHFIRNFVRPCPQEVFDKVMSAGRSTCKKLGSHVYVCKETGLASWPNRFFLVRIRNEKKEDKML